MPDVAVGSVEGEDGVEGIGALVGPCEVLEGDGLQRAATACVRDDEDGESMLLDP